MRAKLLLTLLVWCMCLSSCAVQQQSAVEPGFARYILAAVERMPQGGGYAADRAAELRLAQSGVVWDGRQLCVSPQGAAPTFCSAACYMVLLQALRSREATLPERARFSPQVWRHLRVEPVHPDGYISWGRANANGPGFAKWVSDLGAGVNFTSPDEARPGDFLKFFRSAQIGCEERGHQVIFLGTEQRGGESYLRYWSANMRGGYGVHSVPLRRLRHLIFTRITHPAAFARVGSLPAYDPWLASMLTRAHTFEQVCRVCRISPRSEQ